MRAGLALIVVGVWIGAQILKGGALDRLLSSSSAGSTPSAGSSPSAATTPAYYSTGAGTNQPGYTPSAARLGNYG